MNWRCFLFPALFWVLVIMPDFCPAAVDPTTPRAPEVIETPSIKTNDSLNVNASTNTLLNKLTKAGSNTNHWTWPLGFALRFNAFYKDWNPAHSYGVRFDMFRISFNETWHKFQWSGAYRFYNGYSFEHHGWMGYNFTTNMHLQVGIQQVPFGILPYASHNYFFQLPYYVGLEDDYDLGFKWDQRTGPWRFTAAYYPRSEPPGFGHSVDSARYSYDVVKTSGELADPDHPGQTLTRENVERNQFNLRIARTWNYSKTTRVIVGLSALAGQIYNERLSQNGQHWAAAAHLNGYYGRWNLKVEAIRYEYHQKLVAGADGRYVVMGAYDAPYRVASKGNLYVAGVSYTWPVNWGLLKTVTFYEDYSYLQKDEPGYADTQQNVLGALISMPKVYIYLDIASGKNHPWLGNDYSGGLAEGSASDDWHTRFNANFGVYF